MKPNDPDYMLVRVAEYDPKWPEMFEAEAALVREIIGDNLITIFSTAYFGHHLIPAIDIHTHVVCGCHIGIGGFPIQTDTNTAVIVVPPCLCCRHILKMSRKNAGCEELTVCNFAAFFVQQLFDFLVIHPCH